MQDLDESLAWATLCRAPLLDTALLTAALKCLGTPRSLLEASEEERRRASIPPFAAAYLSSSAAAPTAAERHWLECACHHLIPFTDPRYPESLTDIPDQPIAIWLSGNPNIIKNAQLAIVGSRNPTPYGRETAAAFAAELGASGLAIVSGLAEGIDSSAHRGALEAEAVTLAVLGAGIDQVYPKCNKHLHGRIERQGALLSEFPPGTPPRRTNFPRRNRIIAGLGLGTLVVEAAERSGSLLTARRAAAYGRTVFAVPGSIHNPLSRGCHQLIKHGAKLVESAHDILNELQISPFFPNDLGWRKDLLTSLSPTSGMDKDHKILLDALGFEPVDLDLLAVRTGFKPEAVSSMMLILELEGHVQAAPGGRYSRVVYRRAGGER